MREIRYHVEGLQLDDRTLTGCVMKYGDIATIGGGFKEKFEPGSLVVPEDLFLHRFHEREKPIATRGFSLDITDAPEEMLLTARMEDTPTCNEVLSEVRAKLLNGFSLEFEAIRQHFEGHTRVISKALVTGLGLVDKPAYSESTLKAIEARWKEAGINKPKPKQFF